MSPTGAAMTAELADRVAAAAVAVLGVTGLAGGHAGEIATYLPGRRVLGVRTGPAGRVEVHVVAEYGTDLAGVAESVRDVVHAVVDAPVDIHVDDVCVGKPAAMSSALHTTGEEPTS